MQERKPTDNPAPGRYILTKAMERSQVAQPLIRRDAFSRVHRNVGFLHRLRLIPYTQPRYARLVLCRVQQCVRVRRQGYRHATSHLGCPSLFAEFGSMKIKHAACGGADVAESVVLPRMPAGPTPLAARGLTAVLARAGSAGAGDHR
jgi:hypothetical protein